MHFNKLVALAVISLGSAACVLTIGDGSASATVSASDPTTGGTAASTSTDAASTSATTDASTSTPTSTSSTATGATDSGSTAAGTTTGGDTGPAACGWVADQKIYACGGMGEDPSGIIPIECLEPPVTDAPCDGDQGPIADPGCCSGNVNAYCYLGKLVVTDCS